MARAFEASYALADAYIKEDTRIAKAISDLKVREKTRLRPISAPVDPENARQLAKDIADSVEIWCAEASKKLAVADPKQSK